MATSFPTALDTFVDPVAADAMNSATVPHHSQHANANDAISALEAKVGIDGSAVATSLDKKVATLIARTISAGTGLTGGGSLAADRTLTLANTAVAAASYGSATAVATFTVDAQGRLTTAASTAIAGLAATVITTAQLATARGGTGLDTSAAANGKLLIGNGSGLTLATLTAGANVTVTNGAGTITIAASGGGGVSIGDAIGGSTAHCILFVDGSGNLGQSADFKFDGGTQLLTIGEGVSIVLGTSTGTKIGTSTSQKLAFYGQAQIVQPTSGGVTAGWTGGLSSPLTVADTFTGNAGSGAYTVGDIVAALKALGLIAT